jgi:cation-transporting ATPase 13A3/4/5
MCGDGVNDYLAFRKAHVSVILSSGETSIWANFTSKNPDISCIYEIMREGKCFLTTSIQIFKYMMLFSMIQIRYFTELSGGFKKFFLYFQPKPDS